jgi:SAM-dependent methyltransferase
VGCGNGDFLKFLQQRRPQTVRFTGIDLFPPTIDGIETIRGDLLKATVAEPFDAVVSLAVIEHAPNVRGFVERLFAACKPGGLTVIMTLDANGLLYSSARLARRAGITIASDRLYSSHHLHHFTTRSLCVLLELHGFRVLTVHHHNAPIQAMDVPAPNEAVRRVLLGGVAACFGAGRLTKRCYLQTIVSRRPA